MVEFIKNLENHDRKQIKLSFHNNLIKEKKESTEQQRIDEWNKVNCENIILR